MLRVRPFVFVLVVLVWASSAHAAVIFVANLNSAQENNPANTSTAFGSASFLLNDAQTALTFTATINGIDVTGSQTPDPMDNLSAAHIHAAPPGVNGGVIWGFFGAPDNDINPDDLVVTPFGVGVGGVFSSKWDAPEGNAGSTLTSRLNDLLAGNTYINFHTPRFPGGEIRGQITPVPEPATLTLVGLGALGVWRARRRKPRAQ